MHALLSLSRGFTEMKWWYHFLLLVLSVITGIRQSILYFLKASTDPEALQLSFKMDKPVKADHLVFGLCSSSPQHFWKTSLPYFTFVSKVLSREKEMFSSTFEKKKRSSKFSTFNVLLEAWNIPSESCLHSFLLLSVSLRI